MPRCIKEYNLRMYFKDTMGIHEIKIFGFDWDGSVGNNSWFVFTSDGFVCWFVHGYESSPHYDFEIIKRADPEDWTYIGPWNSFGLTDHDFRGCDFSSFIFTGTRFINCKLTTQQHDIIRSWPNVDLVDCEIYSDNDNKTIITIS